MGTFILFGLLFLLLLMGVPIAVSLGLATTITMLSFTDQPTLIIAQKMFTSLDKFALMAIPLFILAGNFLSKGGAAKRVIRFARAIVGHLPGGLPMSAIFACIIFAAVSGSSPATVAAIGGIMIGAIEEDGYSSKFSVGSIVCAGSLGILIPPSIVLIVYGITVDQSIGKLFMAGVVPGALLGLMLMIVTYFSAVKNGRKIERMANSHEIWDSFKDASWGLFVIVIVIGGIYGGIFTPTEAAAVSAVYGFFVVKFIYKERGIIARELHDELGQNLTALRMDSVWFENYLNKIDQKASKRAKDMSDLIDKTINDVRSLAFQLRPGSLDDLGIVDAVESLVNDFEKRTNIITNFNHNSIPDLNYTEANAVYRIIQEALTNAAKHSDAATIDVKLTFNNNIVKAEIKDDGKGFKTDLHDDENRGFGLTGMEERANLAGGKLSIKSVPERGTAICFIFKKE